MTTLEEIKALEKWVTDSKGFSDAERQEWLTHLSQARTKEEVRAAAEEKSRPASDAELDVVMNTMFPESRTPLASKPESEKSDFDKLLDDVCKLI